MVSLSGSNTHDRSSVSLGKMKRLSIMLQMACECKLEIKNWQHSKSQLTEKDSQVIPRLQAVKARHLSDLLEIPMSHLTAQMQTKGARSP